MLYVVWSFFCELPYFYFCYLLVFICYYSYREFVSCHLFIVNFWYVICYSSFVIFSFVNIYQFFFVDFFSILLYLFFFVFVLYLSRLGCCHSQIDFFEIVFNMLCVMSWVCLLLEWAIVLKNNSLLDISFLFFFIFVTLTFLYVGVFFLFFFFESFFLFSFFVIILFFVIFVFHLIFLFFVWYWSRFGCCHSQTELIWLGCCHSQINFLGCIQYIVCYELSLLVVGMNYLLKIIHY